MPAVLGGQAVRLHDHRQRVPADVGLEAALERAVARILLLLSRGDGVDVGRVGLERQVGARAARVVDQPFEQEVRALRAVRLQHRIDGLEPLLGFGRVEIFELREFCHQSARMRRARPRMVAQADAACHSCQSLETPRITRCARPSQRSRREPARRHARRSCPDGATREVAGAAAQARALAGTARAAQGARGHRAQHRARQQPADARRARLSASGCHAVRAPRARRPHAQGGGAAAAPRAIALSCIERRSPSRSKRCSPPLSRTLSHSRPFARKPPSAPASSASCVSAMSAGRRARGRHGARQQSGALAHGAAAEQARCGELSRDHRASSPGARPEAALARRAALRKLGANAFLAVAAGNADRTAGIAHLRYRPPPKRRAGAPDVALVGKGILFDTGGTNLKPHRACSTCTRTWQAAPSRSPRCSRSRS